MSLQSKLERTKQQIRGTAERPRLSVTVSNKHIYAQVIDDTAGNTLAFSTSYAGPEDGTMTEKAVRVGRDIAQKARQADVTTVVFDRRGKKYHGRMMALADAAREEGLEF